MKTKKEAIEVIEKLKEYYPDCTCSLDFSSPFEMMIAVMLSAQCTDERVNKTTPALFAKYNTPETMAEADLKDIYDVDFLWTIIGNYATEEGVLIDMNVVRNTTSASSIQNSASSNFIVCDLRFVATGKYMNLASFIQSMEDDDRLSFEINNFNMQKSGENLQVTLTVKEIKINADNFIESGMTSGMSSTNYTDTTTTNDPFNVTSDGKAINSMVQTIDSTTTGTTNTTYNAN